MYFDDAVADFPPDKIGTSTPPNVDYTPYHLVEHLRITQWDILDYIRNPNYQVDRVAQRVLARPQRPSRRCSVAKIDPEFKADLAALREIVQRPSNRPLCADPARLRRAYDFARNFAGCRS